MTKSDSLDPVLQNENFDYTIHVTNDGPDTAENIELTDTLPAGIDFVSLTAPVGMTCAETALGSNVVHCDPTGFASGSGFILTLHVNALTDGIKMNTVSVSSTTFDPNLANNSATESTTVDQAVADISVTKSDSLDPVLQNENFDYTIHVTNAGPNTAQNIELTDTLPAGIDFVSLTGPVGLCAETAAGSNVVHCGPTGFASGSGFLVVLHVKALTDGIKMNTVSVSSPTFDPDLTNNSATESTTVDQAVADVSVTKSDSADPVSLNGLFDYTIHVTNAGPNTAQNIELTDTLPAGIDFISLFGPAGLCAETAAGSNVVHCGPGGFASGSGFTLILHVQALTSGTKTNTVTVSSPTFDPDLTNNSATEQTDVTP